MSGLNRNGARDYYLQSELGRIIGIDNCCSDHRQRIIEAIHARDDLEKDQLVECLSEHYRKNRVWGRLRECSHWKKSTVDVSEIVVDKINDSVNHVLQRHDYRLVGIAKDPETPTLDEFARVPAQKISDATLMGVKRGNDVKLVDGIHRAIVLAVAGKTQFNVWVGFDQKS